MKKQRNMDHIKLHLPLILFGSLALGAIYQWVLAVGNFWNGFLAASSLIFLCGMILYFAWVAAQGGKALAWMMVLAFIIRLVYGGFLAWGLPRFGYDELPQQAGFVFEDAYRRDGSAWDLASSGESLVSAFSDAYETDQYGGILALSAFIYRTISSDAHRPGLIVILVAGAMALSVPFLMAAVERRFSKKTSLWAGWIIALYPEGILLGASQMREPFLILFFTILFWAAAAWLDREKVKLAVPMFIFSIAGLLLFSFRVAMPIIGAVFLLIWVEESARIKRLIFKAVGWIIIVLGLLVGVWFFRDWVDAVLHWDVLQTVLESGRVQFQLEGLPSWLHFPFILIYGLLQPVLPAAVAAPAPWIWRSLGILRALGWYILLPLLAYAFIKVWQVKEPQKRRWLKVIVFMVWVWIFVASARAGGDQWDNPRYRTIFLPWMALAAGWGLQIAREIKDRWLLRGLLVEGIFLAFFTEWYISRYNPGIPRLEFWVMIFIILILSAAVIVFGWNHDRKRAQSRLTDDRDSL